MHKLIKELITDTTKQSQYWKFIFLLVFKAGAARPHRSFTQKQGRYPQ